MTQVTRATLNEGEQIFELINIWAGRGQLLPRTLGEVYENIRDFYVVREENKVVGCAALHITWNDLAELKSIAVLDEKHSNGYGKMLVKECVEEGKILNLSKIFALTYQPQFFEKLGWKQADVMTLPQKVWNECYRCPKFPACEEIAVTLDLN
ncbi:MAG: N-acetyltransferase [Dehalococcoidia bacterium]|jgi:amino-acid N-acetyltransferase|nr:N-acetyltransferase [Dehalococcoidia bacterium]